MMTKGVQTSIEGAHYISDLDAKQERMAALEASERHCIIGNSTTKILAYRMQWMNWVFKMLMT